MAENFESSNLESSNLSSNLESTCLSSTENENVRHEFKRMVPRTKGRKHDTVKSVSKWNRQFAESFGVYYAKDYVTTPREILLKAGQIDEFTHSQYIYMEAIKSYLHVDAVYDKHTEIHEMITNQWFFRDALCAELLRNLELVDEHTKEPPLGENNHSFSHLYAIARQNVGNFILELRELLNMAHEYMTREHNREKIPEDMYSRFAQSFLNMCQLRSRLGTACPSHWNNLCGYNVTSAPDYRLFKMGTSFCESFKDGSTVVSVVQVKRVKQKMGNETVKRKHNTSTCSSSSSCSSASVGSPESSLETPALEDDLGSRVLGQHAGELLLDFKKYGLGKKYMPGIIVNGTLVYFTLLEMNVPHFVKLFHNKELDKNEDRATIYYSRPLDILIKEERNILIENFLSFNNFHVSKA